MAVGFRRRTSWETFTKASRSRWRRCTGINASRKSTKGPPRSRGSSSRVRFSAAENPLQSRPRQDRSCDEPLCHRGFCGMMATRVLYMEERRGQDPDPNYAREFDARIVERGPDFVVLDQTLFYAEGGGQPDDTGSLR